MRPIRPTDVVIVAWLALMLALPLSYYVGGHVEDERFAWRMFSTVRLTRCQVEIEERIDGDWHPVPLSRVLHTACITHLQRGPPGVGARFVEARCEGAPDAVRTTRSCRVPGRSVPRKEQQVHGCEGPS